MTVQLYVKVTSGAEVVRLTLQEAMDLRDWLNVTLPACKYPQKK